MKNTSSPDINQASWNKKSFTFWIILALVAVFLFGFYSFYKDMVALDETIKSSDAQVANMYQRRAELIPQIAQVVEAAAKFEGGTLTNITAYRSMAGGLNQLKTLEANGQTNTPEFSTVMNNTLLGMRLMQEAYPQLQSVAAFKDMAPTIEWSENRLRTAIKDYNDQLVTYNTKLRSFPYGIIGAKLFGFTYKDRTFAEIEKNKDATEEAPKNLFGTGQ